MRKVCILLFFPMILLLTVSCGQRDNSPVDQETTINDLIYNQDKIDNVEVTKEQEGVFVWNIKEAAEIKDFLESISNISLDMLTKEQDIDFMNKGLRFVERGLYRVDFYAEGPLISGQLLIWPDGEIYCRDAKSLSTEQQETSYLSKDAHPQIYQWIIDKSQAMVAKGLEFEKISARYWLGDEGEKTIEYYIKTVGGRSRNIINNKGDTILTGFEEYDLMLKLILAKRNGKWGLYDNTGANILSHTYEEILNPEMPDGDKVNGPVRVKENGLWGAVDQEGKIVIEPKYDFIYLTYYEEVEPFIKVEKKGKFGYVTRKGKPLVDTVWDTAFMDVLNVPEDIIFVKQGNKWGGIRVKNEKAAPVNWNLIPSEEARLGF